MIELREITPENFDSVIALSVNEEQISFVASNVKSIAQAKVYPSLVPLAVYEGEEPVGFVMYGKDPDDDEFWISRLMIDKKHQGKGYGKAAMKLALARIVADGADERVFLSFEPENDGAKALYEKLGFKPDGRVLEGEIVYVLQLRG